jgi:histidinol-phosphate/aromatic aminotransferase/cobyric acid decarboxylase-like protein
VALFVDALASRGVHVRDRSKDPTTPGCIRITAGMLAHTDAAIEALESVVAGRHVR